MSKITVIVPVYKVQMYINRCIDSILSQTFDDFELLLIDDGSPDNCPAICDEYATKDSRIHVIHQRNAGLSAARNAGIDWTFTNSDSEWVTFIDSDDWVHCRYLELLYYNAVQNNTDISMCYLLKTNTNEEISLDIAVRSYVMPPSDAYLGKNDCIAAYACGRLYKKQLFSSIRFPTGKVWEDLFTTYKLLFSVDMITVIDEPLYFYFQRGDSIVNQPWHPNRLDMVQALKEQIAFFTSHKNVRISKILKHSLLSTIYNGQYLRLVNTRDIYKKNHYIRIIRREMRLALFQYRRELKISKENHPGYYELAFPVYMWFYWRIVALFKRFRGK